MESDVAAAGRRRRGRLVSSVEALDVASAAGASYPVDEAAVLEYSVHPEFDHSELLQVSDQSSFVEVRWRKLRSYGPGRRRLPEPVPSLCGRRGMIGRASASHRETESM